MRDDRVHHHDPVPPDGSADSQPRQYAATAQASEVADGAPATTLAADEVRHRFLHAGTLVLNLISSPGSGKTSLLEATIRAFDGMLRLAVLEADMVSDRDSERIRSLGVPARQILTGGACHLHARQVRERIEAWPEQTPDVLFIENIGNLACAVTCDLGEDIKVALLSVAEGEDAPLKYPTVFARAGITLLTKADLIPYLDYQVDLVRERVARLRPSAPFLVTSTRSGRGIDAWCRFLESRLADKRLLGADHRRHHVVPPGSGRS